MQMGLPFGNLNQVVVTVNVRVTTKSLGFHLVIQT